MNLNIARFALVAAFTLSAASAACSAPAPEPLPTSGGASTESQDQRSAKADDSTLPPSSGDKSTTPPSTPDGTTPPDGKGGGKGEGEPLPPADPNCVATCNTGLKAKCQGDDTFCEDICSFYTPTEIACITQAPTCEKSVWVGCIQDQGGGEDEGGGGKGGGK